MKIEGRKAIVSGGASGLGGATGGMLGGQGARVVIEDINEKAGNDLAKELGTAASFVKTDVTNEDQMRAAVQQAGQSGGLHIAVATAGIGVAEKLLGKNGPHDFQRFVRTIQINLIGTIDLARRAAEAMSTNEPDEDNGRGVIVTTASVAAFEGQIGQAAYSASKGGIVSITLPLAPEHARFGIRIMSIAPGIFDTPLLAGPPARPPPPPRQQRPVPPPPSRAPTVPPTFAP